MHLATRRSRPNPIRSKTKQNTTTLLAECSGRLLERISNGAPRGMTVQRQNPAYRFARVPLFSRCICAANLAGVVKMSISSCKTAIVTGASRGLGRQIALYLATQNINIVVNYAASRAEADAVAAEINAAGGRALARNATKGTISATSPMRLKADAAAMF